MLRSRYLLCLLYSVSFCACGDAEPPTSVNAFDKAGISIEVDSKQVPLQVELAATAEQRSLGLMDRPRLPANAGMLFLYSEPQSPASGFWMFHTRIPLDIAFLSANGEILAIESMVPCASPSPLRCPSYAAGVMYMAALEVNQGFFESHEISVGDRVLLPRE